MTILLERSPEEVAQLRQADYNAELWEIVPIQEELRILRVRPDWGHTPFAPGQYSVLGLGNWERRAEGCQEEDAQELQRPKLLKRAYSCVFLCGNPAMIGAPRRGADGARGFPSPKGMVEILVGRGFRPDEPGRPGNIHFEKYW